jgi:membrane-bound metal-dependent hydrolase YbcI (DUF457 family)
MLGRSHLLVGAAGFITASGPLLELAHQPALTINELVAGTVVCAGAAMLPDLDHPNATVARSLGPITAVLSKVVSKLAGGHRMGTHSLPFAAAMGVLVTFGLSQWQSPILALALCFFFTSLVVRVLTEADGAVCAAISAAVAGVIVMATPAGAGDLSWLALAITLGCLLHMLADMVTTEGIPLAWPASRKKISIPLVGDTGGLREKLTASLAGLSTCYVFATVVVLPALFPTAVIPTLSSLF